MSLEGLGVLTAPATPAGRKLAGRHHLDSRRDVTAGRTQRFRQDPDSHAVDYGRPRRLRLCRVVVQQLDHLLASAGQVSAQVHEHLTGHPVGLPDDAEQDVLGADVLVPKGLGFG